MWLAVPSRKPVVASKTNTLVGVKEVPLKQFGNGPGPLTGSRELGKSVPGTPTSDSPTSTLLQIKMEPVWILRGLNDYTFSYSRSLNT